MRWDTAAERWQEMYDEAKTYYELNGNLKVPRAYKTVGSYDLNSWLANMKRRQGCLNEEQISALTSIGIQWRATARA